MPAFRFIDLTSDEEEDAKCNRCQRTPSTCNCCSSPSCSDMDCIGFCIDDDDEIEIEIIDVAEAVFGPSTPVKKTPEEICRQVPPAPMKAASTAHNRMRTRRPNCLPYRKLSYEEAVSKALVEGKRETRLLFDRYANYWRPSAHKRSQK